MAGIAVSITRNETAQRRGRARVVTIAMGTAAVLSLQTGWSATALAIVAAALVALWNTAIYFDSSALTAGTVQAADKELRDATMGLHSMCGYAGGFVGRLDVGLVLDWAGGAQGWGLVFGHLALITLTRAWLSWAASAQEARCKAWRRVLPRKLTAARCSGAGKRSPRHRPGKRARKCRS